MGLQSHALGTESGIPRGLFLVVLVSDIISLLGFFFLIFFFLIKDPKVAF